MSAQQEIEKLRTIQESMHEIADKVVSLGDGSVMLNDVAEGKKQIADAINTKGGNSTPDESFQQLAEDIEMLPNSGISAEGIVQAEPFSFLKYLTTDVHNEITEINDSEITTITRDYAFNKNTELREVIMSGVTTISGSNTFYGCTSLKTVSLPNLALISSENTFSGCTSLKTVSLPNLTTIRGNNTFISCTSLKTVSLPDITTITHLRTFYGCTSLQMADLPNITTISGSNTFYNCTSLQTVTLGVLIVCVETFNNPKENLRNITIGQNTNISLPFQYWTASSVIAEGQSSIDELNSNLYNNLLTKLYDHSNDGETRTLRLGWLAHVTQENIDYANSKGWTLTT